MVLDDLSSAVESALLDAMGELAEEVEWELRRKASGELNESRQAYLDGLSVLHNGGRITIVLDGGLAVAVEQGSKPHDTSQGSRAGKVVWYKPPARNFRTVTGKPTVTGNNWVHPGIEAHDFIGKVSDDVENRLGPDIINNALDRIQVK